MFLHKRMIPEEFATPPFAKANKLGFICGAVHKRCENISHDNVIKQGKDRKSCIMRLITPIFFSKCLHCIEAKCLQPHLNVPIKKRREKMSKA